MRRSFDYSPEFKYAQLLFVLPMPRETPAIPARTWLEIVRVVENGTAIVFKTANGEDQVVLDFVIFGRPSAGTVIYGTGEKIT